MCAVLRELTYEQRHTSCVKHALSMFSTWSLGNYHQFFKLYKNAPNLSGAVIDMFLERERTSALKTISKAYVVLVRYGIYKDMYRVLWMGGVDYESICMTDRPTDGDLALERQECFGFKIKKKLEHFSH